MSRHAPAVQPSRRGVRRLGDIRIGTKLALILLVPVLAVIGLAGYLLAGTTGQAIRASRAAELTALASRAGDLAYALELERAAAATALLPGARPEANALYEQQSEATDDARAGYQRQRGALEVDQELATLLTRIDAGLGSLIELRVRVRSARDATWSSSVLRYRILIADLVALRQAPAEAGLPSALADQVRASAALSAAVEQVALEHIAVLRTTSAGRLTPAGLERIVSARIGFTEALEIFNELAQPEWRAWWNSTVTGDAVLNAQRVAGVVAGTRLDEPLAIDVAAWNAAMVGQLARMREVIERVDEQVVAAVAAERQGQLDATLTTSTTVLLVIVVAILVAAWVARSMARRLVHLRESALAVAYMHLPDTVARLRQPRPGAAAPTPSEVADATPIPVSVSGSDEVSQVADAFVLVTREAVRHAAEQALLRTHVAAMFVTLARRLQNLIDYMIRQLDAVEENEQDPTRLDQLFGLDHTANRIGRYTESLLVLGGASSARLRHEPTDLWDVLRGAAGQVERYQRIQYGIVDDGVAVAPHAVDHVVHALAELLDNATAFSPPEQEVVVEARRIGDRVVIQVNDRGLGISAESLAALNDRLANPPEVDLTSLRTMGLATVAAIASWHHLTVVLSTRRDGGMMAELTLPSEVIATRPRHARLPEPGSVGSAAPSWMPWPPPRYFDRPTTWRAPAAAPVAATAWAPTVADNGWRAAAAATAPQPTSVNDAGLPVREPMAHLVPGSVPAAPSRAGRAPVRDARKIAAAMRAHQQGIQQGLATTKRNPGRVPSTPPS